MNVRRTWIPRGPCGWTALLAPTIIVSLLSATHGGSLPSNPTYRGVGIDSERGFVLAEGVNAVTAGALLAGGGVQWVVALKGGELLLQAPGDGGGPVVALAAVESVAVFRRGPKPIPMIAAALKGGGIVAVDPRTGTTGIMSEVTASALAAADLDGDGWDEILATVEGVGIVLVEGRSAAAGLAETTVVSELSGVSASAGRFLEDGALGFAVAISGGGAAVLLSRAPTPVIVCAERLQTMAGLTLPDESRETVVGLEPRGDLLEIDPRKGAERWLEPREGSVRWEDRFLLLGFGAGGAEKTFLRGDANLDGIVDISDAITILQDLFLGSVAPASCRDALDVNDDGQVDISDPIFGLNFLFLGGPSVPAPYPREGADPTPDAIECLE